MADIEVGNLNAKVSMDDSEANKSLAELTREVRVAQSEFKRASVEVDGFGKGTDGLRAKADSLTKSISAQQQLVNKLRDEHEKAAREKGNDAKQTQNYEVRLNKASAELAKLQNELRETNTDLEKQTTTWNKVGTALDGFANKMESAGRKMSNVGMGLTVGLTTPIAAVGGLAGKAAIDFESAFAGVRKTVNATEEELSRMSQGIRDMSKEIPAAVTEIAGVAEAAGQLGIKTEAIMGFTRTMVDLGVATNLSGEQAATALARLANITQMPQSEFDRLGSTIVALGNNLATTEAEIVEMGLRLAGAGQQIGLTEAQILAIAGSLSSVGIEAEAGGTAFSRVMIEMANAAASGGKQLNNFAAVSGLSAKQFKQTFEQDASAALITFIEGLGKLSAAGENTFAALDTLGLGEIRVRDALLRASGAGDLFRESLELGSKAWEENNALTNEAEARYGTTASQMQIFRNKLNDTAITAGNSLAPALIAMLDAAQPIINAVGRMAEGFASLDTGTQKTVITIVAVTAAVGPLIFIGGKLVTAIGAITAAVKGLATALTFLATNPIGLA
ncbi:MAG: phage tail tape measure protein, partial [Cohnella sp.]|nr:phage tail tape measure protein [Cohnella sp.]